MTFNTEYMLPEEFLKDYLTVKNNIEKSPREPHEVLEFIFKLPYPYLCLQKIAYDYLEHKHCENICSSWLLKNLNVEDLFLFLTGISKRKMLSPQNFEELARNPAFWDVSELNRNPNIATFFATQQGSPYASPKTIILLNGHKRRLIEILIEEDHFNEKVAEIILTVILPWEKINFHYLGKENLISNTIFEWYRSVYDISEEVPTEWIVRALSGHKGTTKI